MKLQKPESKLKKSVKDIATGAAGYLKSVDSKASTIVYGAFVGLVVLSAGAALALGSAVGVTILAFAGCVAAGSSIGRAISSIANNIKEFDKPLQKVGAAVTSFLMPSLLIAGALFSRAELREAHNDNMKEKFADKYRTSILEEKGNYTKSFNEKTNRSEYKFEDGCTVSIEKDNKTLNVNCFK